MPRLTRRLGLAGEGQLESLRRREVLLEGFVRAHEELDQLQEAGALPRTEREHLEHTIDEAEATLLEGLVPLADEPAEGEEERLAERIGALVAQRRRIEALRHAGASRTAAADDLVDEIDRRIALLGERLACERDPDTCWTAAAATMRPGPATALRPRLRADFPAAAMPAFRGAGGCRCRPDSARFERVGRHRGGGILLIRRRRRGT